MLQTTIDLKLLAMSARPTCRTARRTAGQSFTRRQLMELEVLLSKIAGGNGPATVAALHGCLTAVALLPTGVAVEQWAALLWGQAHREPSEALSPAQDGDLDASIARMYDDIVTALGDPEHTFVPVIATEDGPANDGEPWCRGFLQGMALFRESWRAFLSETGSRRLLLPIFLLGAEAIPAKWRSLVSSPEKRAGLAACIPAIVESMATELLILELATTLKRQATGGPTHRVVRHKGVPAFPIH